MPDLLQRVQRQMVQHTEAKREIGKIRPEWQLGHVGHDENRVLGAAQVSARDEDCFGEIDKYKLAYRAFQKIAPSAHATTQVANPGPRKILEIYHIKILAEFAFVLWQDFFGMLPFGAERPLNVPREMAGAGSLPQIRAVQSFQDARGVSAWVQGNNDVIDDRIRCAVYINRIPVNFDGRCAENIPQKIELVGIQSVDPIAHLGNPASNIGVQVFSSGRTGLGVPPGLEHQNPPQRFLSGVSAC